jgi:hypothetical protein
MRTLLMIGLSAASAVASAAVQMPWASATAQNHLVEICVSQGGDVTAQTANTLTCTYGTLISRYTILPSGKGTRVTWTVSAMASPNIDVRYILDRFDRTVKESLIDKGGKEVP